jgi:hypothetical protein
MDIGAADLDDDGSQARIWFDFAVCSKKNQHIHQCIYLIFY